MTAGDIPITIGMPDQGFEGYRFVGYNLYDTLILWDLSQGETEADVKPGLATEWSVDPENHNVWTYKLREGVKFHDGCDFNADNVVWNYNRYMDEKHPNFNPQQFGAIRTRTTNIASVDKVDDYTVTFTTKEPDSLFPLQTSFIFLISQCALEAVGGDYGAYAMAPSGTGPYKFDKLTPRERLELVPNTDYWDETRIPKHDRLVLLPMPEATTRAAALMSGQVDFVEAPSPDTIPMLEGSGMQIVTAPYPHNWGYQLNFVDGPFKDKAVRQAANYAINREEMVAMLNGYAIEGYGVYPPTAKYYGNPFRYEYDPEKAKAMLAEAGCEPCEITLAISTSGSGQMQPLPMNELVKSQLEAAGFTVTLDVMDWNKLIDVALKGRPTYPEYDGINVSRAVQDPFSGMFRFMMSSQFAPNGSNFGHYKNDESDALVKAIYEEFDPVKRDELLVKAHEMFVEEALMLFITHDVNPRAIAPNVKGFVQAQSWFQDLTPVSVE
ncbi:ABC transporter substrate-binding protein [Oceanicola sp. 22II-s10i]|uniref:ABC transporter substrate-binding protein n=1 Tax=Oceanicola sp. 22II-s10i TaxID=1317116 RepID=UPI001C3E09DC|nr:ABC transporter substrate-binding protein [Oceanicola sp. 22II-s10i]